MKLTTFALLGAAGLALAACGEEDCTVEMVAAKQTEISTKITALATKDPAKVAELTPKAQELATKATAADGNLAEVCKAYDEFLAAIPS